MKTFFLRNTMILGREIEKSLIDSKGRPFFFREHYDFRTKNRKVIDRF